MSNIPKVLNPKSGINAKVVLTSEQRAIVEKYAVHLTLEQLAKYLGIATSTLQNIKARDEDISSLYEKAQIQKQMNYIDKLEEKGANINLPIDTAPYMFFLKTKCGYSHVIKETIREVERKISHEEHLENARFARELAWYREHAIVKFEDNE